MSETKFSADPWKACHGGECPCGCIWAADGRTTVARAYGPSDLDREGDGADQVPAPHAQQANAALISAAPELYALMQEARKYVECCDVPDLLARYDAALFKARGGDEA